LIDCLDFYSKTKKFGDGNFFKTKTEKPLPLKSIPRNYCQYGIPEEMLLKRLSLLEEKPDLIGITSGMTHWYPGAFKVIEITRHFFKDVPVILGGIYATLCHEHAKKYSEADVVFKSGNEWEALRRISELTHFELRIDNWELKIDNLPYPSFDLYPHLDYVCITTTRGCPFRCTYCASPILSKGFVRRDPLKVVDEIEYWTSNYQIQNIAFYDDGLLVDPPRHFIPMMKEVIRRGIQCNFHTPNALHIREIGEEVATLLYQGRFRTIRLGFETSNEEVQTDTGGKVNNQETGYRVDSSGHNM